MTKAPSPLLRTVFIPAFEIAFTICGQQGDPESCSIIQLDQFLDSRPENQEPLFRRPVLEFNTRAEL
jgi:hypothetical protein